MKSRGVILLVHEYNFVVFLEGWEVGKVVCSIVGRTTIFYHGKMVGVA